MNLQQIYKQFGIPVNLQRHMLSTGCLTQIIVENWTGPQINQVNTIQASLLHDIAKPINFDLAKQAQFGMKPTQIATLAKLQKYIKQNYGLDEFSALNGILNSIHCNKGIIKIAMQSEWKNIPNLIQVKDYESLIEIYSDMRVSPRGIVPMIQRIKELSERTNTPYYGEYVRNGLRLESMIYENVSVDLDSITDEMLSTQFPELLASKIGGV